MAKSKQRSAASAVQRREQARQQQQRQHIATASPQNRGTQKRRRATTKRSPWPYVIGAIVLVGVIVIAFVVISNQSTQNTPNTPVPASLLKQVTNVDPGLLSQTGTGGISNPFQKPSGSPPLLTGPNGKPEVFYYGGEFCPYCAAERWPVVIALSRFGTFHKLYETTSSSTDVYPDTATFTFYQSSYSSQYVDFVAIEGTDRNEQPLQSLPAQETKIVQTYDSSGTIPFMDIGNKFLLTQPSYSPGDLRTNPKDSTSTPLTQQEIMSQIGTGGTVSQDILGSANYLTAAICTLTNNQPDIVCNDPSIVQIEGTLNTMTYAGGFTPGNAALAIADIPTSAQARSRMGLA
jgi:hypothetical protein